MVVCVCDLTPPPSVTGKLIEIEQHSSLHTTMRPGWEDLVRRCMQMFLNRSEGQPWSYKHHYQDGMSRRLHVLVQTSSLNVLMSQPPSPCLLRQLSITATRRRPSTASRSLTGPPSPPRPEVTSVETPTPMNRTRSSPRISFRGTDAPAHKTSVISLLVMC